MTRLRAGMATDAGRTRSSNQDALFVDDDLGLWAVADGMGGHQGGEVASAVAVEALSTAYRERGDGTLETLLDAAASANSAVWDTAERDPDLRGMGTTLVAIARLSNDEIGYLNVGDSRIYLLRDGTFQRLTSDHSLVEELVREGAITAEEARTHPRRNVVTRVLGQHEWVQADANTITPYTGDRYLLCSDGLTGELEDERIHAVLRRLADPAEAAAELVRLANEAGGRDNITVVVVDVVDDGGRAEKASAVVAKLRSPGDDPAGFSSATTDDGGGDDDDTSAVPTVAPPAAGTPKPRRFTLRVAAFLLLVLVVLGGAVAALGVYARGTYFVTAAEDGSIVVLKGREFLWFRPTVADDTLGVDVDDLRPAQARDVRSEGGHEEPTLEAARAYVIANTTTTTSTTTTTTPTTLTPPTAPTTPVPPATTPGTPP